MWYHCKLPTCARHLVDMLHDLVGAHLSYADVCLDGMQHALSSLLRQFVVSSLQETSR